MTPKKLNNVRLNWFMFGALVGIFTSFVLSSGVEQTLQLAGKQSPADGRQDDIFIISSDNDAQQMTLAALPGLEELSGTSKKIVVTKSLGEEVYPKTYTHTLKSGETLANLLTDQSIDYAHAHTAISALRKTYNPRNLRAGQEIKLTIDRQKNDTEIILSEMRLNKSATEEVVLKRLENGDFKANAITKPLQPELTLAGGTITSSLFETGYANNIPDGVLTELMQAYSYDVDFQREIQRGDQVEVLFEKMLTEEGKSVGYGDILYANLKLRGKPLAIYRYIDKSGMAGFFNEHGESVIKALLKTPVNGARISSGFGKRRHPILGYTKMHQGTDFAAATGTPIYAAGDGTIAYAGRKGGYGNYIKIRHNDTYETAYAHLHRFASTMRSGKRVKQGQVIGYVGSTGRSTGPHLHYEVHKNGRQVNPMQEKFKTGRVLKGVELAEFKRSITKIKQQVAAMPREKTTLAAVQ